MKKIAAVFVLFFANAAVAQVQECNLVSPAKNAKFEALKIPVPSAITEYMTAIELIDAEGRAFKCELPPREMIREFDTGIAWRVTKFAQVQGRNYTRMLVEYGVSGGYTTLTGTVAIKWLKHNDLIAKFNAWDAADVRHNYEIRTTEVREQFAPATQPVKSARPSSQAMVVQIAQATAQGFLVQKVQPEYPSLARQARIQGSVLLHAVIGKDGTVQKLDLISGHPMLAPAAIEAVKQWRYKPYYQDGTPVRVETQVTVNFSLSGG